MTTKISITRALAELKLLNDRITTASNDVKYAICVTKKTNHNVNKNDFTTQTIAKHQSLMDLINRRHKIKSAIMMSNLVTKVHIGSKEMTVAEAIEVKHSIHYKEALLDTLRRQRMTVVNEYESHKARVKQTIDANINNLCNRDVKPDPTVIQELSDMMWKNDPVEIFDPINMEKTIEELKFEIDEFKLNVDFALSESNSLTQIEV